jgi:hypothetical protein
MIDFSALYGSGESVSVGGQLGAATRSADEPVRIPQ